MASTSSHAQRIGGQTEFVIKHRIWITYIMAFLTSRCAPLEGSKDIWCETCVANDLQHSATPNAMMGMTDLSLKGCSRATREALTRLSRKRVTYTSKAAHCVY